MELLLPAGNFESVKAAVQNGADAVYFGGKNFNARRNAANFEDDFLKTAIDYCALRGVKTYLTLNTLILDKELKEALKFAENVYNMGIDAVIVQDMGLVRMLKKYLPDLELHASTQMGVCDVYGAALMKEVGFKRVVLSRETPLNEIKHIHDNVDIELEAFAHGAMCVSFSGHCLFSSMVGSRSGNRGTCAQPCRKKIKTDAESKIIDSYDLSLADLCMIEHMTAMKEAGVSCIKIEGRMKRSEYVAQAARAYRSAIDGAEPKEIKAYKAELQSVFDRGGFCTGNYFKDDRKTGCIASSTADEAMYERLRSTFETENKKRLSNFEFTLKKNEYPVLKMKTGDSEFVVLGDVKAEEAKKPMQKSRVEEQLRKLGATVFECESCIVEMDDDAFIPISVINEMRRKACQQAEQKLLKTRSSKIQDDVVLDAVNTGLNKKELIICEVNNIEQAKAAFESEASEVAYAFSNLNSALFELEALQEYRENKKLLLSLPHVVLKSDALNKIKQLLDKNLVDGAIANNIGQISLIKDLDIKYAGIGLNVFNAQAASMFLELGFNRFILSGELTKPQMRDILNECSGSVFVYGRCELMQLTHCALKEQGKCKNCKGDAGTMTDEENRVFKLRNVSLNDECIIKLLNCDITDIRDLYCELPKADSLFFSFYDESEKEIKRIIQETVSGNVTLAPTYTRGHFNRPVE